MSEQMIVACPECETRFVAPLEKFLPSGRKVRCAKCKHMWFQAVESGAAPTPDEVRSDISAQTDMPAHTEIPDHSDRPSEPEPAPPPLPPSSEDRQPVADSGAASASPQEDSVYAAAAPMPQVPPVATPEPRRGGLSRILFYGLAAAIVAAVIGYLFREPITQRFPALESLISSYADPVDRIVGRVIPDKRPLRIENVKYDFEDIEGGRALLLSAEVVNGGDSTTPAPKLAVKVMGKDDSVLHETAMPTEDLSTEIEPEQRAPYYLRIPHPPEDLDRVEVDFADAE